MKDQRIRGLAMSGLMAALVVLFTYFIKIPVPAPAAMSIRETAPSFTRRSCAGPMPR